MVLYCCVFVFSTLLIFYVLVQIDARCTLGNLMKAQGLVSEVREKQMMVQPSCSYVRSYVENRMRSLPCHILYTYYCYKFQFAVISLTDRFFLLQPFQDFGCSCFLALTYWGPFAPLFQSFRDISFKYSLICRYNHV